MSIPPRDVFTCNPLHHDHYLTTVAPLQGDWTQRYRALLQLGALLPPVLAEYREEIHRVPGCESAAWLWMYADASGLWWLAESDAKISKGLLALAISRVNGLSAPALLALDLEQEFTELGLAKHLSQSRAGGFTAMLKRMRQLAAG